jgi:hypothetical protein
MGYCQFAEYRRMALLRFIVWFINRNHYPPTIEEMRAGMRWSSKSLVAYHLDGLEEEVVAIVDRWEAVRKMMHCDHEMLFVSMRAQDHGAALEKRAIRAALDYRLHKLGIKRPGVSCHSLRHLMATEAVRNKVDLPALQLFLGHSDIATTMLYPDVVSMELSNPAKFASGLARRRL